jgi:hypothetical protein
VPAFSRFPASAPPPVSALGPLPECRLVDILTVPRDYDSWSTTLVDWLLSVGEDYVPPDLVPVSEAGITGPGLIRQVAIDDLRALAQAAADAGNPIAVNSPTGATRSRSPASTGGLRWTATTTRRPTRSDLATRSISSA